MGNFTTEDGVEHAKGDHPVLQRFKDHNARYNEACRHRLMDIPFRYWLLDRLGIHGPRYRWEWSQPLDLLEEIGNEV